MQTPGRHTRMNSWRTLWATRPRDNNPSNGEICEQAWHCTWIPCWQCKWECGSWSRIQIAKVPSPRAWEGSFHSCAVHPVWTLSYWLQPCISIHHIPWIWGKGSIDMVAFSATYLIWGCKPDYLSHVPQVTCSAQLVWNPQSLLWASSMDLSVKSIYQQRLKKKSQRRGCEIILRWYEPPYIGSKGSKGPLLGPASPIVASRVRYHILLKTNMETKVLSTHFRDCLS